MAQHMFNALLQHAGDKFILLVTLRCDSFVIVFHFRSCEKNYICQQSKHTCILASEQALKTADKDIILKILGYGTVFIKHTISVGGTKYSVTTKLSPVYYAPDIQ